MFNAIWGRLNHDFRWFSQAHCSCAHFNDRRNQFPSNYSERNDKQKPTYRKTTTNDIIFQGFELHPIYIQTSELINYIDTDTTCHSFQTIHSQSIWANKWYICRFNRYFSMVNYITLHSIMPCIQSWHSDCIVSNRRYFELTINFTTETQRENKNSLDCCRVHIVFVLWRLNCVLYVFFFCWSHGIDGYNSISRYSQDQTSQHL